jgi:hydroxymethylpyrimidine/phosphomethylpyrimidine kinase
MTTAGVSAAPTAIALTIAGSDSSGGAGIQADLKTFSAFGVYGASVITALTAQNTLGVQGIETVSAAFVAEQLRSVLTDLDVGAVKTGMLANAEIVEVVASALGSVSPCPLVVDPVMVATSGDVLLAPEAVNAIKRHLLPLATLVTPNLPEAAILLASRQARNEEEMTTQGKALLGAAGCHAVLIKGGHDVGDDATDILVSAAGVERFVRPRIATLHSHGTGCTLSAAIAALLSQGTALPEAVDRAKTYVWEGLRHGSGLGIGKGRGPIDHLFAIRGKPPPA